MRRKGKGNKKTGWEGNDGRGEVVD